MENIYEIRFQYTTCQNRFTINSYTTYQSKSDINSNYEECSKLCRVGCKNFNKKYSCPPLSKSFDKLSNKYEYIVVNAFQIPLVELKQIYNSIRMANIIAKSIQRKIFDKTAQDLKAKDYKFLMLENGSCRLCKVCLLQKNEPCKHPDKMRFSLEATGIDVNDLTIKCFDFPLKWYKKKSALPEYQCVVGGILTNEPEIIIPILNNAINEFILSVK